MHRSFHAFMKRPDLVVTPQKVGVCGAGRGARVCKTRRRNAIHFYYLGSEGGACVCVQNSQAQCNPFLLLRVGGGCACVQNSKAQCNPFLRPRAALSNPLLGPRVMEKLHLVAVTPWRSSLSEIDRAWGLGEKRPT